MKHRRRKGSGTRALARYRGGLASPFGSPSKIALNGVAAAAGFAAASSVPFLSNRIVESVPITYGAALGLAVALKAKNPTLRWAGFGAFLGGGLVEAIEGAIGDRLASAAGAPAEGG